MVVTDKFVVELINEFVEQPSSSTESVEPTTDSVELTTQSVVVESPTKESVKSITGDGSGDSPIESVKSIIEWLAGPTITLQLDTGVTTEGHPDIHLSRNSLKLSMALPPPFSTVSYDPDVIVESKRARFDGDDVIVKSLSRSPVLEGNDLSSTDDMLYSVRLVSSIYIVLSTSSELVVYLLAGNGDKLLFV